MRRRFLIAFAATILDTIFVGFLFFKTIYLPRRAAAFLDERLASFPVPVHYEIASVGILPPSLVFETVVVGFPDRFHPATFSSCSVSGVFDYAIRKRGVPRISCERAHLMLSVPEAVSLPFLDEDRGGSSDTTARHHTLPAFDFSVGEIVASFEGRPLAFTVEGGFSGDTLSATVTPRAGAADAFLTVTVSLGERRGAFIFNRFPVEPYARPWLPDEKTYARGFLSGTLDIAGYPSSDIDVDLSFEEIAVSHPFLDSAPFLLPFLRMRGAIAADIGRRHLFFNDLVFSIGGIEAHSHGTLTGNRFDLAISLTGTPLTRLVTVMYNRLFDGFLMEGSLAASVNASGTILPGDVLLDTIGLSGSLDEARQMSDRLDRFRSGFDFFFTDDDGRAFRVEVKNRGISYAPLALLPEYVYRAVVLSEDAGFFLHNGIDFAEMDAAFKDNLTRRELRGGSTITQQLVKNLFLTRDKTLLRKFRELLLAIELDATLPKERILEIYLNLIEWGPGVFGIGNASQHYFGKLPEELMPHEAVWLASIIPNPKRFQHEYLSGNLSEARTARLQRLLDLLFQNGYLSGDLYLFSYTAPLLFRHPEEELLP